MTASDPPFVLKHRVTFHFNFEMHDVHPLHTHTQKHTEQLPRSVSSFHAHSQVATYNDWRRNLR